MAAAAIRPDLVQRSDSDVSPRTTVPRDLKADYFPTDADAVDGSNTSVRASDGDGDGNGDGDESSARKSSISFAPEEPTARGYSLESNGDANDCMIRRKSSTGSVAFRRVRNPSLPQGNPQQMSNNRIRASSPPPASISEYGLIYGVPTKFALKREPNAIFGATSDTVSQSMSRLIRMTVMRRIRTLEICLGIEHQHQSREHAETRPVEPSATMTTSLEFEMRLTRPLEFQASKSSLATTLDPTTIQPPSITHHVAFDNVPTGEPTKNNAISLTLNVRHKGYQSRRRSRTFMVGVDEHAYSDYALQWLLDELVDDGDEVVCVRVIEKEIRYSDKQYQENAQSVMQGIIGRNGHNRAINIILEYAVGKLHVTFQTLIQMYQPAMLIVGTRGRTLGGLQGLVNTRNSFSKYCLQYSPVPVVVVRPTEKRMKKKTKRANDSSRQTYLSMLSATSGKHEADSEASSTYELEVHNSPDEEAHQVARALGLPASFDPTIKPINHGQLLYPRSPGPAGNTTVDEAPLEEENQRVVKDPANQDAESDDDDDDDDSAEFEVITGLQALDQQKMEQLHKMEVGEAAAFKMKVDESDDEEEAQSSAQKGT
ncbi:hypothetical protein FZEAL_4669 [Fusarium zealandicum]|uniref:UspA domain-containing protein n=1 Tax=Fusarium zealandicum TaxID=1053134 RepID=A0A8H4XLC5_9HYPO|nr:hypothetical protein FZEAL_4669 [Fusarium zealandicum]